MVYNLKSSALKRRKMLILLFIVALLVIAGFLERRCKAERSRDSLSWNDIVPAEINEPLKTCRLGPVLVDVPQSFNPRISELVLYPEGRGRQLEISVTEGLLNDGNADEEAWLKNYRKGDELKKYPAKLLTIEEEDVSSVSGRPAYLIGTLSKKANDETDNQELSNLPYSLQDEVIIQLVLKMPGGFLSFSHTSKVNSENDSDSLAGLMRALKPDLIASAERFLRFYDCTGRQETNLPSQSIFGPTQYGLIRGHESDWGFGLSYLLNFNLDGFDPIAFFSFRVELNETDLTPEKLPSQSDTTSRFLWEKVLVGDDSIVIALLWVGVLDTADGSPGISYTLRVSSVGPTNEQQLSYFAGVWQTVLKSIRPAAVQEQ